MNKKFNEILLMVLLFPSLALTQQRGAELLIIAPDSFYNSLKPLADWKTKKGIITKIATLSETGSSSTAIRNYVINAYNSWQIRPKYLLLVGGPDIIPYPSVNGVPSDNYYVNMDGTIANEIVPGRIPAYSILHVQTVVNKILAYERTPFTADTAWFLKGICVVREDGDEDDSIYWSDARYVKNLMLSAGYIRVDTFSRFLGNNATDVINALNDGRSFLLYRGQGVNYWWSPFNVEPDQCNNGSKLPIVGSITCKTIAVSGTNLGVADKFLLTGTPTTLRGAVGVIATSTVRSNAAQYRSVIVQAFFGSIFSNKYTFGEALEEAKRKLNMVYPGDQDCYGFHCLGDPTMLVWTGVPRRINVSYDSLVYYGSNVNLNINVSFSGMPVESAYVCLMQDSTLYLRGYTDREGNITFSCMITSPNNIYITVTGHNLYPHEGIIRVIVPGIPVLHLGQVELTEVGDGDGILESGEAGLLRVWIKNVGEVDAYEVSGRLRASSDKVFVRDSISYYGLIGVNDSTSNLKLFAFSVSPGYRDSTISFVLFASDSSGLSWNFSFILPITTYYTGEIGPDAYGYFIYDHTDTLTGNAPTYFWLEVATGLGTIVSRPSNADADTQTIPLPFPFKYYGVTYNSIGICSNGFLELGGSTYRFATNLTPLPSAGGPKRVLAPFWTDLNPQSYGDIYQYYDTLNHRFIVEYYQCAMYGDANIRQTFQVVLLDPAYYQTPTGDGEILFLYNNITVPSSICVGIEDHTETSGITYLFNGAYTQGAAPLTAGTALLITTKEPSYSWIVVSGYEIDDNLYGNANGLAEPGESLHVTVTIINKGLLEVSGLNLTMRSLSPDVEVVDSVRSINFVGIGDTVILTDPFIVHVVPEAESGIKNIIVEMVGNNGKYRGYGNLEFEVKLLPGVREEIRPFVKVYPNPLRGDLFVLVRGASVRFPLEVKIYDVAGRAVKSFRVSTVGEEILMKWDGRDRRGNIAGRGIYFVSIKCGSFNKVFKIIKVD